MVLVRLILAFVLAVGFLPARGGAMAAAGAPHPRHEQVVAAATNHCPTPCAARTGYPIAQDHCQAATGACCAAPLPDAVGAIIALGPALLVWARLAASVLTGLSSSPAIPPPRV